MQQKELWDWECRLYERKKTRNEQRQYRRYRIYFWLSIAAWAGVIAWLLTVPAKSQEVPFQELTFVRETKQPVQRVEEPAVMGRLPGDDVPATAYANLDAIPITYLGEFIMTHYCPCERCCGQWADGITSTGTTAQEGRTIAVDPTVIPYGTEVEIQYLDGRFARYIAEDCGGAIKGNHIDVFMNDHDEALEMGVISGSVYVVGGNQ